MSVLTLRLQKRLEIAGREIATSMGAVATLRQVTDGSGRPIESPKPVDVVIPANNSGEARRVSVAPGLWVVEATLPSGEMITGQVDVKAGKDVPLVLRTTERSPHEWLGWQHLLGNIEGEATLELLQQQARKAAEALAREALGNSRLVARISEFAGDAVGYLWSTCVAPIARLLRSITTTESRDAPEQRPQERLDGQASPAVVAFDGGFGAQIGETAEPVIRLAEAEEISTADSDPWTTVFSNEPTGPARAASMVAPHIATWVYEFGRPLPLQSPDQPIDLRPREFVCLDWRSERYAIALPLPWPALDSQTPVPVQIMVRSPPLPQRVQIGVAVMDQTFGPLSGFMTASTLPKAAVVVDQAYDMLFEKTRNPLAAAAAGYILLAAGDPAKRDWYEWIGNLERLFPALPDGDVLKGSLLLRDAADQKSIDQARAAFLSAYDRGIPYFTVGVSRLLDGLTLFSGDLGIDEKLTRVRRVAQRLDLSQAFTVVRLSDRPERRRSASNPAAPQRSIRPTVPNGGSLVMNDSVTPTTFSTVDLQPEATASLDLPEFVNTLLEKLRKLKDERFAYYDGLRQANSRWANSSRQMLSLLGSAAFLITALAATLRFAPKEWGFEGKDQFALLAVLAIYAVMGAMSFYERGTDKTATYFRHLTVTLAIRDLWTKLQFELLKEFTALNSAADKAAALPVARERMRALAEAFSDDLNKASTSELTDWRTEFMASLSQLADRAKSGSDDVTKQLQEAVKAADKSAADAKSAAETAAKALADAGKPGSLNVTIAGDFDGEVVLSVDGVEVARGHAKSIAVERVVPGIRKFSALAQMGANKLEASHMVEVKPGLQDLTLSLT